MKTFRRLQFFAAFFVTSICFVVPVRADRVLEIPGTGDSQKLLRTAAAAFNAENDDLKVVIPDSVGSGGGIKLVGTGRNVIGRVARKIKKKEERYGLSYLRFAASPVVFGVSHNVSGITNLSADQAVGIYSGTITDWSALGASPGPIYLVGREPGDSSRKVLEKEIPGFREIDDFSGVVSYSTPEAAQMLENHDNTIAYLPFSMAPERKSHILGYQGVQYDATDYRLNTPFGLVWKGTMTDEAARFVDFLFSPRGKKIIIDSGAVPVNRR